MKDHYYFVYVDNDDYGYSVKELTADEAAQEADICNARFMMASQEVEKLCSFFSRNTKKRIKQIICLYRQIDGGMADDLPYQEVGLIVILLIGVIYFRSRLAVNQSGDEASYI